MLKRINDKIREHFKINNMLRGQSESGHILVQLLYGPRHLFTVHPPPPNLFPFVSD